MKRLRLTPDIILCNIVEDIEESDVPFESPDSHSLIPKPSWIYPFGIPIG
jgi:hypothetical protein